MKMMPTTTIGKRIVGAAAVVVALASISGTTIAVADVVFWSEAEQKAYTDQVAAQDLSRDIRKLKQQIMKLQLEVDAGKATAEDKAFLKFLKQDLEAMQPTT